MLALIEMPSPRVRIAIRCPVQRAGLIYDAEILLSSEPETSCLKASQSFSRCNISTPIGIGEVLQQHLYPYRLVLLDLL